jgi:hypothetical protein
MSFDPRSRERLEALGRTLPQKLPTPQQAKPPVEPSPAAGRHRLETEQDPEALFRELITASADGSVPSHLLERLRELESSRPQEPRSQSRDARLAASGLAGERLAPSARSRKPVSSSAGKAGPSPRRGQAAQAIPPRRPGMDAEQQALYSSFEELLRDSEPDD